MKPRLRRLEPAVLDGRGLADLQDAAWIPAGDLPSAFEFARACGLSGRLADENRQRRTVRVVALLYLGGRIFAEPGGSLARFGVLLRARGSVAPGTYDLEIAGAALAPLRGVPIRAVPAARVAGLGGNLYFLIG